MPLFYKKNIHTLMPLKMLRLKKGEERRIIQGHPWIYSNEVDTKSTPLASFSKGEEVYIEAWNKAFLGSAYLNPKSLIVGRIFSREKRRLDSSFFEEKIASALRLREQLFQTPYYRLVFSEGDSLPGLIADRFGDELVLQLNTAGMAAKRNEIVAAFRAILPQTRSILLRNDSAILEREGLSPEITPLFGHVPQEVILEENGIRFAAPIIQGQKTGWFYDHRFNRARLRDYVPNKQVLDVFSYLGGWAITAAHFGAKAVDCIEISSFAAQFIQKNTSLALALDKVNVMNEDAFVALKQLLGKEKRYDVIILDPPAFIKKLKDKKAGLVAYQRLNELALKLLTPEGILISCSCSMHLSAEELHELLKRAALRSKIEIQLLERGHQAPDHPLHIAIPETDYLKALFIRKIS